MASTKTSPNTSNGTGRLPSTRERRPALAALAVLLIVGGALASAWLAMQAGHRDQFVQVRGELGQGAEITEGDLDTVELPEDFEGGVPESEMDDLVGKYTATPWTPGMVVTESMFTDENEQSDENRIALQVDPPLAPELTAGTNVVIYTGGGDAVAGTVTDDVSTSNEGLGSSEVYAVISIASSCGNEVSKAKAGDTAEVLVANSPDSPDARSECS